MSKSMYWNDILTKGAILGCAMLVSHIFEQAAIVYGKSISWITVMGFETIIAAVIFVWLLYRFTKQFSLSVMASQGDVKVFTYGNGLGYAVMVSLLAGVIVGVGAYIFHNLIVGHQAFVQGMIETLKSVVDTSELPSTALKTYNQSIAQTAAQPAPTILSTLISSMWRYMFWGTISALFIAAKTKHESNLFNDSSDNAAE